MKQVQKQKQSHKCKHQHIHSHNKVIDHKYCKKCNAQVQTLNNGHCICCGSKISFKDHKSVRQEQRVLNHFLKEYETLLAWWQENDYTLNPLAPIILQLKVGSWIYQLDIKYLSKYYHIADLDGHWMPTTQDNHHRIPKRFMNYDKVQATIDLIKPKLHKVDFEISWNRSKVTIEK